MLIAFAAFALGQIPTGAYGMPELCDKLRAATGIAHTVDADLRDFPVFVATKTGDPERVKLLVGDALRAKWVKDGERYRLTPLKVDPEVEFPEFERRFKAATKGNLQADALDVHEVFRISPGETIRFGYPSDKLHKPFQKDFEKKLAGKQGTWYIAIRRMGEGIFESRLHLPSGDVGPFSSETEINFSGLPAEIETALKADLNKRALTAEEQQAIQKSVSSPAALGIDWSNLDKRDPVATLADRVLLKVAATIQPEMAIALPDVSLFVVGLGGGNSGTVRAILEPFSQVVDMALVDGAVVGKLPLYDRLTSTSAQVRRPILQKFIGSASAKGVPNMDAITEYMRDQRQCASNCWTDMMMLVMAGVVVDQEYIGDYPYNARLYASLDRSDWNAIRTGQPFPASQLDAAARHELADLLVQARDNLSTEKPDPTLWASLDPANLSIRAELVKEQVLIGWTGVAAEVYPVRDAAGNHDMRMRAMKHEPLYQPASRQKLKLTVTSIADNQSIETGFTEVTPDPNVKPSTWDKLPSAIAKEFKDALEAMHLRPDPTQGVPPPSRG